jgi:PAS domain S-box-containing protein
MASDRNATWFVSAVGEKKAQVSQPYYADKASTRQQVPVLDVYHPIVRDKEVVCVIKARILLEEINSILRESRFGKTGKFILTDNLLNILHHHNHDLKAFRKKLPVVEGLELTSEKGEFTGRDGERKLYRVVQIPGEKNLTKQDWNLVVMVDKTEALALVSESNKFLLSAAVGALFLGLMAGSIYAGRVSKSVSDAGGAALAIAGGDFSKRLPAGGIRELAEMAEAFNQMSYQVLQHKDQQDLLVKGRTKALTELNALFKATYESITEGILVTDMNGKILSANNQLNPYFGVEPEALIGQGARGLFETLQEKSSERDALAAFIQRAAELDRSGAAIEFEFQSFSGPKVIYLFAAPVSYEQQAVAVLWMFEDKTEQRRLERSLLQTQKMDAVGRLAGGMAHDFNNLLMGILGAIGVVEKDSALDLHPELRQCLRTARGAGVRASEHIKQLLSFSRKSQLRLKPTNLNDVVLDVESLVALTVGKRVKVEVDLADSIELANADGFQIEQVLVNMVVNADHAMPDGGTIRLSSANCSLSAGHPELLDGMSPGNFVRLSVGDTGIGMSQETMAKIFEPFFTTKEQSQGTGLGLATSFGIIQQHGGWITCESKLGEGAEFRIYLPVCEAVEPPAEPSIPTPTGAKETILVVDDELVVRMVVETLLKRNGYNVYTAVDGEEALEKLARHDGAIDLVVMDLTMPRLDGKQTFAAMRRGVAKTVPVVICSGYLVDEDIFLEETGHMPEAVLRKPFDNDELLAHVRRILQDVAKRKIRKAS